ncbi:unnamed protein product [Hydatigera taeniaeformis]|uniref:Vacuolar protein sorting-associated protein 16 homolog n=1 Tax=Hydatigena taeniaeformis TaxID=6205 RepID=A0A0R3X4I4_HYDTA|nr:unnamed protein product [Hydatigera taeniaeformis]
MIGTPLDQIIIGRCLIAYPNTKVRRLILYKLALAESHNFSDFFIAVGGCGGLIAFLQKPRQAGNSVLIITTAAGKVFAENLWKDAPPVAVSWSDSEELAVVQKSGYVTILNLSGAFKRRFGFGKDAENNQIIEAKFFSYEGRTAVGVITGSSQILVASSLERPRILAISTEVPLTNRAFVWQVLSLPMSGEIGAFKGPWVLLALDKEIHCMGVGKAMKVEIPNQSWQNRCSAFHKMAISPNEERVAFYMDSGLLLVAGVGPVFDVCMELDFSDRAASLVGNSNGGHIATLPSDMAWLDNSTVALQWQNFVVITDLEKNVYELFYPSFVHIQPEVDGLRVLTPTTHEIIQRVPQELECLGRIGASSSAVLLLSAYREWEAGSGRAHEFLRPIHSASRMHDAVSACLLSAAQCVPASSSDFQRTLLAAAHFGRSFLSIILAFPSPGAKELDCSTLDNLSELTIQITTILRLLNSIAVEWIGMALTWKQFEVLGPSNLLNRLLARKHYPLAVELVRVYQKLSSKIPEHIQMKTTGLTRILCHWVKSLTPQSANPSDTNNSILIRRLFEIISRCGSSCSGNDPSGSGGGVSFAAVAETAIECGQLVLAERLLELEPRISAQISLLMRLRRYGHALTRAVQSGDADLLLAGVLQPLQEGDARMEPTALSLLLRQHPIALALYRQYLEGAGAPRQPRGKLASQTLAVLQQEDDPALGIQRTVLEAFSSKDSARRSSLLLKARDSYQQIKADFLSHTCEEAGKLINFHRRLEEQQVTAPYFCLDTRSSGSHVLPQVLEAAAFRWQGASVNATYTRLIAAGTQITERLADHVRREFKMPEKRVAYLRLIGLALSPNTDAAWTEIERMAFVKRPPVQLDVFVKIYTDAGRLQQAADIIGKLPLEQRIRSLILIGQSEEAINLAIQERSEPMLCLIQRLLIKIDRTRADQVGLIRSQLSS